MNPIETGYSTVFPLFLVVHYVFSSHLSLWLSVRIFFPFLETPLTIWPDQSRVRRRNDMQPTYVALTPAFLVLCAGPVISTEFGCGDLSPISTTVLDLSLSFLDSLSLHSHSLSANMAARCR